MISQPVFTPTKSQALPSAHHQLTNPEGASVQANREEEMKTHTKVTERLILIAICFVGAAPGFLYAARARENWFLHSPCMAHYWQSGGRDVNWQLLPQLLPVFERFWPWGPVFRRRAGWLGRRFAVSRRFPYLCSFVLLSVKVSAARANSSTLCNIFNPCNSFHSLVAALPRWIHASSSK